MKKLISLLLAVLLVLGLAAPALAAETETETETENGDYVTVDVADMDVMSPDYVTTNLLIAPNPNATTEGEDAEDTAENPFGYAENENSLLIAPNPNAGGYAYTLVFNGEVVNTAGAPAGEGVPVAATTEDGDICLGDVYYFHNSDGPSTWFFFSTGRVIVDDATGAVRMENEDGDFELTEFTATVTGGYILLPTDLLTALGYEVALEGDVLSVNTPADSPLVELAHQILEASGCYANNQATLEYIMPNYDVELDNFEEGYYFSGFMTTPDCLIIAKLAEGADQAAVQAALAAYRQSQHDTFSWYLTQNLYKVEQAQLVIRNGYAMLLIAEDSAAGLEVFSAYVGAQAPVDPQPGDFIPATEDSAAAYIVKKGDTMGFIALNFYGSNGYHRALSKANAEAFKATKGKLVPGMVLTLPEKLGKAPLIAPAVPGAEETLYTVKLGDTLGKIAKAAYGNSALYKAIYERNSDRLKNANSIYEGQVIVLPAIKTVTIKVVDSNGKTSAFTYTTTSARTLADLLLEKKLAEGNDDGFGLEILTVNGITADWEKDMAWWKITDEDGEEPDTGSNCRIADGDVFTLTYTVGF